MITEADTCRKYVLPKLFVAGWNDDQISEQLWFERLYKEVDTLKNLQAKTSVEFAVLLPSILHKAFNGEL